MRLLLEILLYDEDHPPDTRALINETGFSDQTIRNRAGDLAEAERIEIIPYGSGNTYRLTKSGYQYVKNELRQIADKWPLNQ